MAQKKREQSKSRGGELNKQREREEDGGERGEEGEDGCNASPNSQNDCDHQDEGE